MRCCVNAGRWQRSACVREEAGPEFVVKSPFKVEEGLILILDPGGGMRGRAAAGEGRGGGCYVIALRQRPQLARMAGDQALGATQEIQKNLKRRLGVPLTNGITETELWLFQTMHFSLVSTFKLFWETQGVKGARVQSLQNFSGCSSL